MDVHQDFISDDHLEILKDNTIKKGDGVFIINNEEKRNLNLTKEEKDIIKPYYTTEELSRYYGDNQNKLWVIYSGINIRKNINQYPHIKEHLNKFRKIITSDFKPYGIHRAREQRFFEGEKIISLRKTNPPSFTYTDFPCYVSLTFFVIKPEGFDLKYLTGLLNSNLIFFWLKHRGKKQGNQLQVDKEPLLEIPIYEPDKSENSIESDIARLVDKIRNLEKQKQSIKLDSDKRVIEQEISAYEKQINKLVYKLYKVETYSETIENDVIL